MFSNWIRLLFATTAYAPVVLIWWFVNIYNIYKSGYSIRFIDVDKLEFNMLFCKTNLIFFFLALVFSCWYILLLAKKKLTKNIILLKSVKSADLNMNFLILSYFLPCIEMYKKENVYIIGWLLVLAIMIIVNKGTYFYNPLIKLFGYRYYEVATKNEITYLMISDQKIINVNEVNSYSQLSDYIILNTTK